MKSITKVLLVALTLPVFLAGCDMVVVPPTSKGKILTTKGYNPDVLVPGKYTLYGRDELILLDTSTNTYKETVTVVLADKLTLTFDVRFRGRIAGKNNVINAMFNDIKPGDDNLVTFHEVYRVYGQMAVRNKSREIMSEYTVEDVHKNYSNLSARIGKALLAALEHTPLEVSDVALGNIAYPEVVTAAIDAAKKKELEIKQEEAAAEIRLTKKKNERLLAEADYQIKITNAKSVRDSNKIIGEGVTPELIELRRLEVLEKMAANKAAVFMPVEAMSSTGAQVRMFGQR